MYACCAHVLPVRAKTYTDACRRCRVIGLVAVDAGRTAVLGDGPDGNRIAVVADGHRHAELVAVPEAVGGAGLAGVRCLDVRLLRPRGPAAREDVHGAGLRNRAILLVAVDALGAAPLELRRDGQRVPVGAQRDGVAELAAHLRIRGLEVGLLPPARAVPDEHVHCTGAVHRIVVLVSVHAGGAAALVRGADGHGVAVTADGRAPARVAVEHATTAEMIARPRRSTPSDKRSASAERW